VNKETVKGIAIGIGVGLLAPMVFPVVARAARPTVNATIRAGVTAWEKGRETMAEFGEYAEDMMAEARAGRHHPLAEVHGGDGNGGALGG